MSKVLQLIQDKSNKRDWRLGVEAERFVFLASENRIASFQKDVAPVMKELIQLAGWKPVYQVEDSVLGAEKNGHFISLEPGAQFEISTAPQKTLFQIQEAEQKVEAEVLALPSAKNWSWLFLGLNPWEKAEEKELIPSERYAFMTNYFLKNGTRGLQMMRLTTGSHLNFDYYEPEEALRLIRACYALVPFLTALFANSPFQYGKRTGRLSERAAIWEETDPARSGLIPGVLDSSFKIKDYVNFVESTPLMYFTTEEGSVVPGEGRRLLDLNAKEQELNSLAAMRQIFTEARLKPCCVELRSLDQLPPELRYGAFAFAVGLLYDEENSKALCRMASSWSKDIYLKRVHEASISGMKDDHLFSELKELFKKSIEGLQRRSQGEESLLENVERLIEKRQTPAEALLQDNPWQL